MMLLQTNSVVGSLPSASSVEQKQGAQCVEECGKSASVFCERCDAATCESCFASSHKLLKALQSHKSTPLAERSSELKTVVTSWGGVGGPGMFPCALSA